MKKLILGLSLASLLFAGAGSQQMIAFPGAEGYGKYTKGGRGGAVYEVTNLNDSGEGSLRAAVEASGPRTVVFRVSGNIELESPIKIMNPYITIAGQTAPGDGICLTNHQLSIDADQVIIRYIRVRPGDVSGKDYDAISGRYHKNIILDHVSASWSTDECMSIYRCDSVTIQWCIVSESMFESTHVKGNHGFGGIWGSNYSTYHHNLLAHHSSRNPRWGSGVGFNDYRNNVIYNWGYNSCYGGERVEDSYPDRFKFFTVNMVANYYKPGPATEPGEVSYRIARPAFRENEEMHGYWYVADNVMEGNSKVTADNWDGGIQKEYEDQDLQMLKLENPWPAMPIDQQSATEAYESVLENAGASFPRRDAVDARIIAEAAGGYATYEGTGYKKKKKVADLSKISGIIDSQNDVGGWPELKSESPPADTDHDGMPDAWESQNGLNPNDAVDGSQDRNGDGYTNLEEYINGLLTSGAPQEAIQPLKRPGLVFEEFVYMEADFPSCHAPTLLELENGELLCAFFGGTKESDPDVEIRMCRKAPGGKWTVPVSIADGIQADGERCSTGNPVLFQPEGGDVMLFYKVFRPEELWWGEMKTSPDGGRTWSKDQKMPEGLLGPEKNKPIQFADGTILSPSALNRRSGEGGRRVHVERSTDGGKTWTKIGPLNTGFEVSAAQPTVLTHVDGRIQMLMRHRKEDDNTKMLETWSKDKGLTWTPLTETSLPNNHSGLDGVTLKDGRFLIAYNHSTRMQPGMGHKGRGILNVAVSEDGVNWEAALVLEHLDKPSRQFSYPAVIQTKDGLVHIAYTWHRHRIKHVVIDPAKLVTFPIVDGQWPTEHIPIAPVTPVSTAELVAAGL